MDSVSPLTSEILVESLLGLGAAGVQEVEGRLITYLPPPADVESFIRRVQDALREATGLDRVALTWGWQDHQDWAVLWKQGLEAKIITDRLVVAPSWCATEAAEGTVVVTIDPGMAFGTAEHETTRGSLRLLDRALSDGETLLDVGCGSGILSISAACLGARSVLAVDLDPYACEATKQNADVNGVTESIEIDNVAVTEEWLGSRGPFDGILANVQPAVLVPLLQGFTRALGPGGWLILSGITDREWSDLSRSAGLAGLELEEVDAEGEWRSGWFSLPTGAP